ncbi:hypothetical protein BFP70_11075 [Thioclava sp. SK-1]|uniref:hypothetical protein n=1 Tax=Thioclava sp. SK-1 TaxID=1889770 RepID=UPI000825D3AC|nr:hypothetical protein [Thioclava sp. SK-1]OCX64567.1 hypothetical protein BFP70_11075 [Thioclava sp. SK-1]
MTQRLAAGLDRQTFANRPERDATSGGLRSALRDGSRMAHDQLDTGFSSLDLGYDGDYAVFLLAHEQGLRWIFDHIDRAAPIPTAQALMPAMLDALGNDIMALGHQPLPQNPSDNAVLLCPWAVDYVVLGSRLGTEVLRRRRAAAVASAQTHTPADSYFALPFDAAMWREFCVMASQVCDRDPVAKRAIADTKACFAAFDLSLTQSRRHMSRAPTEHML